MIPSRSRLQELFAEMQRIEEHRSKSAEKEIIKIYKEMLKEIRGTLGNEFAKYAEDDALTYTNLARNNEYARFVEEVQKKINGKFKEASKVITKTVTDMYDTAYKGMVNAVSVAMNNEHLATLLNGITLTSAQVIKAAVNNPVSKLTLSKTLEKSRKQIIYNIKSSITTGLMNGDRMSTMARRMQKDIDISYRKAMLIARTEVHRVRETGHDDAALEIDNTLADAGSEFRMVKRWKSMQDNSVRKTPKADHRKMNGQIVLQDEVFDLGRGVTAPCPGQSGTAYNDCNCRCTVIHDIMNDDEFFKATGRHFPKAKETQQQEQVEQTNDENYSFNYDIAGKNDVERYINEMPAQQRETWKRNIANTKYNTIQSNGDNVEHFDPSTGEVNLFNTSSADTLFHETSHAIDENIVTLNYRANKKELRRGEWTERKPFETKFKGASNSAQEIYNINQEENYKRDMSALYDWIGVKHNDGIPLVDDDSIFGAIRKSIKSFESRHGEEMAANLADMIDGITLGKYPLVLTVGGHGKDYWVDSSKAFKEMWAEFSSLKAMGKNETLEEISKILPARYETINSVYEAVYNGKVYKNVVKNETDRRVREEIWEITVNTI